MIIIDIETTGINPQQHAVLSIGAIEFANPSNQFYSEARIWDGAKVEDQALEINGFTHQEITDKTKQSQYVLMKSFIDWVAGVSDHTPAGLHVAGFDLVFLQAAAVREGLDWPLGKRSVDLHTLVYAHVQKHNPAFYDPENNRSNINGEMIQKYCGLEVVPKPHNALTDAKWEAECFSRVMFGTNLLSEYNDQPIPTYLLTE